MTDFNLGSRPCTDPDIGVGLSLNVHDLPAALSDVIGGLRLVDHSALDHENRLQVERVPAAGERDLLKALSTGDRALLRKCTHVPMSRAGEVGAGTLYRHVSDLNGRAGHQPVAELASQGRDILHDLDRLIGLPGNHRLHVGEV